MINPFKEINWKPSAAEIRKFAVSWVVGWPVIALILFTVAWIRKGALPVLDNYLMVGGIGAGLGLVSMVIPAIGRLLYPLWMGFAACIGIVVANLLFTLMYYLLFAPLGLIMRVIGRDPLQLRWKKEQRQTYWLDAPETPAASRYFSQF